MLNEQEIRLLIQKSLEEEQPFQMEKDRLAPDISPGSSPDDEYSCGVAWVENGKIHIRTAGPGSKKPVLVPCQNMSLYVNKKRYDEPVSISEEDEFSVVLESSQQQGKIEVSISPDKMQAFLKITPAAEIRYWLADSFPQPVLSLKVYPVVKQQWDITADLILKELSRQKVVYGINYKLINKLIENPGDTEEVIALGEKPGPPVHDRLEMYFNAVKEMDGKPKTLPDGSVDYRNLDCFPVSVEEGTLIARRYPGAQGTVGRGVDGNPVPPENKKNLVLKGGKGVTIDAKNEEVRAAISGQPVLKVTGNIYNFDVIPVLLHKGNVDLASGNIFFNGSVKVIGDVNEEMAVSATGDVEIRGSAFNADITAQGKVIVQKSIINTRIRSGGHEIYYAKFLPQLSELKSNLQKLIEVMTGLLKHPSLTEAEISFRQLLLVLIDMKFKEIPSLVKGLAELEKNAGFFLNQELHDFIALIANAFTGCGSPGINKITQLFALLPQIDLMEMLAMQESTSKDTGIITMKYALNSEITTSGDVMIYGPGCYSTFISAGGNVKITGTLRGGELIAGGDVTIGTAGSEMEIDTFIRLPADKNIKINVAYPGVRVQTGRVTRTLKKIEKIL